MRSNLLLPTALLVGGLVATGAASAEVASSAQEIRPLLVGAEVPAVTVHQLDGAAVSFSELVRKEPTVVIFYRGGW